MRDADSVYYLHADHLGSTSLATDQIAQAVARQMYHPFGTVRWGEGTFPTDFGFTGQKSVPGTGLVFMHARFYHPALGRFVSADTIVPEPGDPQSLNRYSYAYNNPLGNLDPTGHFSCSVIDGPSGGMDCNQWVYNALAVLDIYGGGEGKELYALFWELDSRFLNDVDILFWVPFDNVGGIAWPLELPYELLIKSDYLASDPMNPANWGMAATLAHELVHLGQDNAEKLSIQGEAKAYQMEGIIVDNLNKNRPAGTNPFQKRDYSVEVQNLDLTTYGGVVEAHKRFENVPGNIYTWQPVFPVDEWYMERWWYQLWVTGTSVAEGAWSIFKGISGLW